MATITDLAVPRPQVKKRTAGGINLEDISRLRRPVAAGATIYGNAASQFGLPSPTVSFESAPGMPTQTAPASSDFLPGETIAERNLRLGLGAGQEGFTRVDPQLAASLGLSFDPAELTVSKLAELKFGQEMQDKAAADLAAKEKEEATKVKTELERQAEILADIYAPKISAIEEGGEASKKAAAFAAAGQGSVRGSRQAEKQVEIAQKTAQAVAAVEAEKAMALQLKQAELEGASDARLEGLRESLSNLQNKSNELKMEVELAQRGLLEEQNLLAQEAQEAQLQFTLDRLAEQGLTIDPFTGQTVSTLEGEEKKAEIANTNADTAKLYKELQNPNVQIKYFSDELGNVTASVFNEDAGTLEQIQLGKLDTATKWAIDALSPEKVATGRTSSTAAEPEAPMAAEDVLGFISGVFSPSTNTGGLPQIDVSLGK